MRIVIDGRMLYWTGVGRYTKALLDNLARLDHDNEYVVLTRPADRGLWEPKAANFRRLEVDINPYTVAEQLRLPWVIAGCKPDLVHFTAANAPVLYRGKRVMMVHDLTLLEYDTSRGTGFRRWVRQRKRAVFRFILGRNVHAAQLVLTPTRYVKNEVMRCFGVAPGKVTVTLLAADKNLAEPESIERLGVGPEFLFNVGNVYPYKNLALAIEALAILAPKYPNLKLVSTAKPDYFRDELVAHAKALGVADRVVFTGYVSDGELVSLYRKAKLYVYPSVSEGFGLQILEAMTQRCPVIASRTSSLPEVGGEGAGYFDPRNPQKLAELIDRLLRDDRLRDLMREAGYVRAKHFGWDMMAEETLAVYRRLDQS
jgi:glycosyltransferase involved in cell wall biosynthesis